MIAEQVANSIGFNFSLAFRILTKTKLEKNWLELLFETISQAEQSLFLIEIVKKSGIPEGIFLPEYFFTP